MIITPIYNCRNFKKTYPGAKQEIPNNQLENFVRAARFTLGSQITYSGSEVRQFKCQTFTSAMLMR